MLRNIQVQNCLMKTRLRLDSKKDFSSQNEHWTLGVSLDEQLRASWWALFENTQLLQSLKKAETPSFFDTFLQLSGSKNCLTTAKLLFENKIDIFEEINAREK